MPTLITGISGTVAPVLADELTRRGHRCIPWTRADTPIDSPDAVRAFIAQHDPDWICHIATGPPDWAGWIAECCADSGIGLLWAGSVSVFGDRHTPPFTIDMPPDATDDYGRYKIDCERRILAANPRAIVARLGWQIGPAPGSNTMTDYLARQAAAGAGRIEASRRWIPSCAMLGHSAAAMADLIERHQPGIYHLEGNRAGLSLFDIAARLAAARGEAWTIIPTDTPIRDNRMADPRITMGQVADALTSAPL